MVLEEHGQPDEGSKRGNNREVYRAKHIYKTRTKQLTRVMSHLTQHTTPNSLVRDIMKASCHASPTSHDESQIVNLNSLTNPFCPYFPQPKRNALLNYSSHAVENEV
jgi:hypothetical protein